MLILGKTYMDCVCYFLGIDNTQMKQKIK